MKNLKTKLILISLFIFAIIINYISSLYPTITEAYYSLKINKVIVKVLSHISSIFPFSIYEIVFYGAILLVIFYIGYTIINALKYPKALKKTLINFFLNCGVSLSIIYFLFIMLWGLNYNRVSIGDTIGLTTKQYSIDDLSQVYKILAEKANGTRKLVKEDSSGVMITNGDYRDVFSRAKIGYENISNTYPSLSGNYGKPKPILTSKFLIYTGITGIYFPFTGEPNVNLAAPNMTLPFTTTHEMAHQRGYASEDEANFIAYLVCINHPDADFQYSGYLLALINLGNSIASEDYYLLKDLRENFSEEVLRDMKFRSDFWKRHEGKIDEISSKVNDTYLKANGVSDGEKSYGRMVDLLLSYYNQQN